MNQKVKGKSNMASGSNNIYNYNNLQDVKSKELQHRQLSPLLTYLDHLNTLGILRTYLHSHRFRHHHHGSML